MTYIKILLLIVIFDPMNDTLNDEERLQIVRLQNKYVTLLHAFLCDSFGKDKGAITFKSLLYEMNKVTESILAFIMLVNGLNILSTNRWMIWRNGSNES